jgi:hypothetical protein
VTLSLLAGNEPTCNIVGNGGEEAPGLGSPALQAGQDGHAHLLPCLLLPDPHLYNTKYLILGQMPFLYLFKAVKNRKTAVSVSYADKN